MNSTSVSAAAIATSPLAVPAVSQPDAGVALVAAASLLLADLERGRAIDAPALRAAMIAAFGGSDAQGIWELAGRAVVDVFRRLGGDLARKVRAQSRNQRGGDHSAGDSGRSGLAAGTGLVLMPQSRPSGISSMRIHVLATSLMSLKEKLIEIGAKPVSHGRYVAFQYVAFQMAEVAIPRNLFADILRLIAGTVAASTA